MVEKLQLMVLSVAIFVLFAIGCTQTQLPNEPVEDNSANDQIVCTMEYAPVCGVDGVTYGNSCMAGSVEIAYQGECGNQQTEPKICTADYRPVCGIDGVTYSNSCMAGSVEIAYEGEC